jgi:hypothetical protein
MWNGFAQVVGRFFLLHVIYRFPLSLRWVGIVLCGGYIRIGWDGGLEG